MLETSMPRLPGVPGEQRRWNSVYGAHTCERTNESILMAKEKSPRPKDPGMGRTLRQDIARGDFQRTMRRDYDELKELFLDGHRKERLGEMRPLKRWLYTAGWLLKSLFFKLTPARRVLFVLSIFLLMSSHTFT